MKTKQASILDFPRPGLCPEVWETNNILKPEIKKFILDFVQSFAQANNFKAFPQWIVRIRLVGSLCTNTYVSQSDCDVHIEADLKKFIGLESSTLSEKEASDYLDELRKQVDQVKVNLPSTQHPIEIYFENEFTPPVRMEWSGAYDIVKDEWLSGPHIMGKDFDVSTFYPGLIEVAKEVAAELDAAFGEVKQEVQDIKWLEETINAWPTEQRNLFEKKLQVKLDALDQEIKELVNMREEILDERHKSTSATSQPEITMKYLQKYFYIHVLTDLKKLVQQSPELTEKDIPVVENILQQAALSKKEAAYKDMSFQEQCSQVIMIDVDDTISHENPDGSMGKPLAGVKEVLQKLKDQGYIIVLDSHRANTDEGREEIKQYMDEHEIPYDEFYMGQKPLAFRYIDDRAIQMTTWQDVLKKVEEAKKADGKIDKECSLSQKYWITSNGEEINIGDKDAHGRWALNNAQLLKDKYKIDLSKLWPHDASNVAGMLIESFGWIRITTGYETSSNADFAVELRDIHSIPSSLDNFIAKHYSGPRLEIDDAAGNFVIIDDPFPSIQKAVNKALRQPVAAALSKKEATGFNPYSDPKFKEGSPYAVFEHIQPGYGPYPDMEMYTILGNHPMFGSTVQKSKVLELGIPIKENPKKAQLESDYDYSSAHFVLPNETAKKLIEWNVNNIPEEELFEDGKSPKGRQIDPHITLKYGLLTDDFGEVKKALEGEKAPRIKFGKTSFFEPEGKNYDVVIIEVESKDLEDLSARLCSKVKCDEEVHKDYNPHATLAYVKKGLGKKWEGKDILSGEELDLHELTFSPKTGEKRTLELKSNNKESSFMPSNTDLAPSNNWSNDIGWPGNSEMDAPQNKSDEETWYSPENDRPRSINLWKRILNLLKPMSKKEVEKEAAKNQDVVCESCGGLGWVDIGDPENGAIKDCPQCGGSGQMGKEADYGPTNYKGPSTPDNDYQNSAWDKMNVTYSPETNDENVEQNGKGGYPQRWFGRPKGKYYTNEGKVVKMLEETALSKKELGKQADLSGKTVNDILLLIKQTGGATYNLSKGNLAGQPYYAVATHPEREQTLDGVDYDRIEEYLVNNEDLLRDPNNSFGAWSHEGKIVLDVVATIADQNQALELGRKHNQPAIFDLKNMQEIPVEKVASLKEAAAVSDREQQKYYDEIYSDRWRDDSSKIDGGNEYYDWSELGSNDYPNPKDEEKEHVYMDLLDDPAKANFPAGLPEYSITFYDSESDQGDKGGV